MAYLGRIRGLATSVLVIWTTIATPAAVAAYPERPVTIVVAWPAGGATDLIARGLQDSFQSATVELFTDQPNLVTQYNLKPLAVYSEQRISTFKDVPTMKEAGYDLQFSIWSAMFAPKGTPDAVLNKLEAAWRATMADPKVVELMERQRQPIDFRDRKGLDAFVAAEFKKAGELIDAAGLRPK